MNLAAATANPFNVLAGAVGSGPTVHATDLELGTASTFATVPSGTTVFAILHGQEGAISGGPATLNLQGGTINAVAIVHNGSMGAGFRLVNLPRCS